MNRQRNGLTNDEALGVALHELLAGVAADDAAESVRDAATQLLDRLDPSQVS